MEGGTRADMETWCGQSPEVNTEISKITEREGEGSEEIIREMESDFFFFKEGRNSIILKGDGNKPEFFKK